MYCVPLLDMPQIQTPENLVKNYYKSVAENKDVSKYVMMMSSAVSSLKSDIFEALQRYSDYAFLWEKDRQEAVSVITCFVYYFLFCSKMIIS